MITGYDFWNRIRLKPIVIAAMLTLVTCALFGAAVDSGLEQESIYFGESVVYQIAVQDVQNPPVPVLNSTSDYTVTYLGPNTRNFQSTSTINGKTSTQIQYNTIFRFRISPKKTGILSIPAIPIQLDGQNYTIPSASLRVREPQTHPDYHLLIETETETLYTGQNLPVTITWLFGRNIQNIAFTLPFSDEDFKITSLPIPNPQGKIYEVPINRESVQAELIQQKYERREYTGLRINLLLTPLKPGVYDLSSILAAFSGVTGTERQRDFWGQTREVEKYERLVIPGTGGSITVLNLPEPPEAFSGIIGTPNLSVSIDRTEAFVGDPVQLRVELSGIFNQIRDLPEFSDQTALTANFRLSDEREKTVSESGEVIYIQMIRPAKEGITDFPALSFLYFNPDTGAYEKLRSQSFPFLVKDTETVGVANLEGNGGDQENTLFSMKSRKEGIYYNFNLAEPDRNPGNGEKPYFSQSLVHPAILILFLLPPLGFITLMFLKLVPSLKQKFLYSTDRSYKLFKHRMKTHPDLMPIHLEEYLQTRLKLYSCNPDREMMNKAVSDISVESRQDLFHLLDGVNAKRYGSRTAAASTVDEVTGKDALNIIGAIEKELLKK